MRRNKWWAGVLVLLAISQLIQLAARLESWTDLLAVPVGLVSAAVLIGGPCYIIGRSQAHRAGRIAERLGARGAWVVQTGRYSTDFLVVTDSDFRLVSKHAVQRLIWPIDQLRQVVVERVPIGTPARMGLRLELGRHHSHETLFMIFPWLGGLWSSTSHAREARSALDAVRSARPAQAHE